MLTDFNMIDMKYEIGGEFLTCKEMFSKCYGLRSKYIHDGLPSLDAQALIAPVRGIACKALRSYSKGICTMSSYDIVANSDESTVVTEYTTDNTGR